jgi:hypothetical protein
MQQVAWKTRNVRWILDSQTMQKKWRAVERIWTGDMKNVRDLKVGSNWDLNHEN